MPLICREAFHEVCILANGDVVCSCIDGYGSKPLGNIKRQSIHEIFYGSEYQALRAKLLASGDDTYCPHLDINCCFKYIDYDFNENYIDKIQLETSSFCNLSCPACAVSQWGRGHPRLARLPIECIRKVLEDTKENLRSVWPFNYGEPFLDPRFLDILRMIRQIVPKVTPYIHTNGNIIPEGWIEAIIQEGLLDGLSFSIDGTSQQSYQRYRVGSNFDVAFGNMVKFAQLREMMNKTIPKVIWQYILFEWNDSNEELQRAQELAEEHGLKIMWITTHTLGRSQKYLPNSKAFQALQGIRHFSSDILATKINTKNRRGEVSRPAISGNSICLRLRIL